jgi:NAD(P)-dependent dehydrogenase (short-subunit alcohol dehydrogenase family)
MVPRVWHISGANTGLGLKLALKSLKEGDQVIAAVRTPFKVPDSLKIESCSFSVFDVKELGNPVEAARSRVRGCFGGRRGGPG